MQTNAVLSILGIGVRTVLVEYEPKDKSNSTIKLTKIDDLVVGEYVLVETGTRHNATVARVVALDPEPDLKGSDQYGWVFARAPMEEFQRLKEMTEQALHVINEAEKRRIRLEITEKVRDLAGGELDKLFAIEHDPGL